MEPLDLSDDELYRLVRVSHPRARRWRALITLGLAGCLWSGVIAHETREASPPTPAIDR